jgi:hypothetical protein
MKVIVRVMKFSSSERGGLQHDSWSWGIHAFEARPFLCQAELAKSFLDP